MSKPTYHSLCWTLRGYYLNKSSIELKIISRSLLTCKPSTPQHPLHFHFHQKQKPLHTSSPYSLKTSEELRRLTAKPSVSLKSLSITLIIIYYFPRKKAFWFPNILQCLFKKKKPTFFLTNEVLDLDFFFFNFLREEKSENQNLRIEGHLPQTLKIWNFWVLMWLAWIDISLN